MTALRELRAATEPAAGGRPFQIAGPSATRDREQCNKGPTVRPRVEVTPVGNLFTLPSHPTESAPPPPDWSTADVPRVLALFEHGAWRPPTRLPSSLLIDAEDCHVELDCCTSTEPPPTIGSPGFSGRLRGDGFSLLTHVAQLSASIELGSTGSEEHCRRLQLRTDLAGDVRAALYEPEPLYRIISAQVAQCPPRSFPAAAAPPRASQ